MMNRNLDAFDARIQRIARDEKAKGRLIAGEGEVRETQVNLSQLKRAAAPKRESGELILAAPKWAMAFLLGAAAMLAGFVLMVLGESDVAGHAPFLWETMFSPEYAARVLSPAGGMENNLRAHAGVLQSSI